MLWHISEFFCKGGNAMTQKELLFSYILRTRDKLEEDVRQLQNAVVRRRVDAVDCLELLLALERLNSFNDNMTSVCEILKMNGITDDISARNGANS